MQTTSNPLVRSLYRVLYRQTRSLEKGVAKGDTLDAVLSSPLIMQEVGRMDVKDVMDMLPKPTAKNKRVPTTDEEKEAAANDIERLVHATGPPSATATEGGRLRALAGGSALEEDVLNWESGWDGKTAAQQGFLSGLLRRSFQRELQADENLEDRMQKAFALTRELNRTEQERALDKFQQRKAQNLKKEREEMLGEENARLSKAKPTKPAAAGIHDPLDGAPSVSSTSSRKQQRVEVDLDDLGDMDPSKSKRDAFLSPDARRIKQDRKAWKKLCKAPTAKIEDGAVLIAAQARKHKDTSRVQEKVDGFVQGMSETVIQYLKRHKDDEEVQRHGRVDYAILELFCSAFFEQLQFRPDFTGSKTSSFLIDKVLETRTGDCVALGVVFLTLARKIGIELKPIDFTDLMYDQETGGDRVHLVFQHGPDLLVRLSLDKKGYNLHLYEVVDRETGAPLLDHYPSPPEGPPCEILTDDDGDQEKGFVVDVLDLPEDRDYELFDHPKLKNMTARDFITDFKIWFKLMNGLAISEAKTGQETKGQFWIDQMNHLAKYMS